MASSSGKMPTTPVRRLIPPLSHSSDALRKPGRLVREQRRVVFGHRGTDARQSMTVSDPDT